MSEFRTKMKSGSGFVLELCLFVPAGCEELVPLVDGGELRLVHDRVLFHQAQSAWVGGGVEGGEGGEGPPLDGVVPVLVLQAPDVTRKAGVAPFARMAEAIYIYIYIYVCQNNVFYELLYFVFLQCLLCCGFFWKSYSSAVCLSIEWPIVQRNSTIMAIIIQIDLFLRMFSSYSQPELVRMFSSYSQAELNVKPVRSSQEIRRCKRWMVLDQMQHRVFPKVTFCFWNLYHWDCCRGGQNGVSLSWVSGYFKPKFIPFIDLGMLSDEKSSLNLH